MSQATGTKYCRNCGHMVKGETAYCPSCGYNFATGAVPEASVKLASHDRDDINIIAVEKRVRKYLDEPERGLPPTPTSTLDAVETELKKQTEQFGDYVSHQKINRENDEIKRAHDTAIQNKLAVGIMIAGALISIILDRNWDAIVGFFRRLFAK